ncbi:hypothetical protein QFC20_006057 [Naganishia adeliensis]|uniref:Uncharacterized protein n=1 Tax=Naganishia adeliensis TaxID=92952 RepID=A0ACC2VGR9_9TREE|nr:hypothetical protein QFC20_006057 [Naganishia adeliensis]
MGLLVYQTPSEVITKVTEDDLGEWLEGRTSGDDPESHSRMQHDIRNLVGKARCTDSAQREVQEKALYLLESLDGLDMRKEWNLSEYYYCLATRLIAVPSRRDAPPLHWATPEGRIEGFIALYRPIMEVWTTARVSFKQKQLDRESCEVTTEPGRLHRLSCGSAVEQDQSDSEIPNKEESEITSIKTEINDGFTDLETALTSGSEAVTSTGRSLAFLHQQLTEHYLHNDENCPVLDAWPLEKMKKFVLDVPKTPPTFSDILTDRFSASLRSTSLSKSSTPRTSHGRGW